MTHATISLTPLSDKDARAYVFSRMLDEGRARIVQYTLPEPSLDEWLKCTDPKQAWFSILHTDARLACAVWINNFCGKSALVHFVVFRGFEHLSNTLCHLASAWAFDGGLACLLGLIPVTNRGAIACMRASGWKDVFRIPEACFVHRLGRHVDALLCHFTPKLLREALP